MKRWLNSIYFSFPLQLLILHIRSNLVLIVTWIILIMMITGNLGKKFGLQYLFLDPEYLGEVNFWSFFFIGLTYGGFLMSWNLTTYLLGAQYFPFLASLSRPFTKFSLNNMIIPLGFFLFYLGMLIYFQTAYESLSFEYIFLNCLGLLTGGLTLILFYSIYFNYTNRDISYYNLRDKPAPDQLKSIAPGHRNVDLEYIKLDRNRWKVKTYLNEAFQPRLVRSVAHYDSSLLTNIFKQNHLNALILQLFTMVLLLALGYLIDYPAFRIPAGASIFILFSIIVAIVGALYYWFHSWSFTIIILLLFGINFITSFNFFHYSNKAYGLDYETEPAVYAYRRLQAVCFSERVDADRMATEAILDNWKAKAGAGKPGKPKMVIMCVSGGGLKSATWAMQVAQTADAMLEGQLLENTVLVTGASGGMLGMAYLRELMLRQKRGDSIELHDKKWIDNISKDLLNSIAFTIVSNDMFLPWSRFEYENNVYHKDRGYIFEEQLNENTDSILDKPLAAYRQPEKEALIPLLYLTPAVVNDGRRMVISPQGVSFMMIAPVGTEKPNSVEVDAVDFGWMFEDQQADNLRFLSALRMNATYPYVLPSVVLPSTPSISVMDAGFRDNYGILSATRFIQVFRDWISENTSGVILLQISSTEKIEDIAPSDNNGIVESLFNPIGIAGKFLAVQEYEHDNSLGFIYDLLGEENFKVVRFIYEPSNEKELKASISFHITQQEKENILKAIDLEENQESLRQLKQFFNK